MILSIVLRKVDPFWYKIGVDRLLIIEVYCLVKKSAVVRNWKICLGFINYYKSTQSNIHWSYDLRIFFPRKVTQITVESLSCNMFWTVAPVYSNKHSTIFNIFLIFFLVWLMLSWDYCFFHECRVVKLSDHVNFG